MKYSECELTKALNWINDHLVMIDDSNYSFMNSEEAGNSIHIIVESLLSNDKQYLEAMEDSARAIANIIKDKDIKISQANTYSKLEPLMDDVWEDGKCFGIWLSQHVGIDRVSATPPDPSDIAIKKIASKHGVVIE